MQARHAPKVPSEGFIKHTVKWFEDIYDVSNAYGVTPQDIMEANGLKSSRISKRQILVSIPIVSEARQGPKVDKVKVKKADILPPEIPNLGDPEIADPEIAAGNYDPLRVDQPVVAQVDKIKKEETAVEEEEEDGILDWLTGKGNVEMALILPFNAAGKASETNMDFYSGVLMALRDLEKAGIKATLNVYDLQAGIPSSFDLGKNDFILGPITTTDLTTVLDRTDGRVPVVSPLDQRAADLADARPGFIQAPSSAGQPVHRPRRLGRRRPPAGRPDHPRDREGERQHGARRGRPERLLAAGTAFEGVSWTQGEGRSLPASLTARLTKGGVNRIIVASEKEAFVSDLVRNLGILLGRGYKIAMYAPSKVRTFETIDGSTYHQNDLHICSPYFADYDTPAVKSFVRAYRALYRTEPSQFAFQGYDLTRYFASLVSKYGNRWTRAITRVDESGLHTDFHFEKTPAGSFRNTGIRRIVYKTDYSTELVK